MAPCSASPLDLDGDCYLGFSLLMLNFIPHSSSFFMPPQAKGINRDHRQRTSFCFSIVKLQQLVLFCCSSFLAFKSATISIHDHFCKLKLIYKRKKTVPNKTKDPASDRHQIHTRHSVYSFHLDCHSFG